MIGFRIMKKQQVFYIHGGDSFEKHEDFLERLKTTSLWHLPSQNKFGNGQRWTGTFEANLGDEYEVIMPPMPNRQNAKFIEWSIWFERHFEFLSDDPIFIGHSLGAMFLAKYLSQNDLPFRPRAIFLMAGAYRLPGFSDKDCGDFLVSPEEASSLSEKI
jgi:predicted alpha/beta hydrolase family esterase